MRAWATGGFVTTTRRHVSVIARLSGGAWREILTGRPADIDPGSEVGLGPLACASPTYCVVLVGYTSTAGRAETVIGTLSGGS